LTLFNRGLPAVNRARAEQGLAPMRSVLEHFERAQRVLVLTSESFDFHGYSHPEHLRYVGSTLTDPPWVEDWQSPWEQHDRRPLVIVSFSSTYMAQEQVLARTIDGLSRVDARVLVTTGPTIDPASFHPGANTTVLRSAPHAQLFPETAVVVTHAGMGTVTRALAAGVPLVCIPMGRDQHDVAARVVYPGAGVRLRPSAKPHVICAAVELVIHEPSFRTAAERIGASITADATARRGLTELEALASASTARR
jgi:MGT family glycosyltransferase